MREILDRLTEEIGWNRHIFTETDLLEVCRLEGCAVVDGVLPELGVYMRLRGRPVIAIDRKLRGIERTMVLAHEVGHLLLHTPGQWYSWAGNEQKIQWQADVFMACALIPRRSLYRLERLTAMPTNLLQLRSDVWERAGF